MPSVTGVTPALPLGGEGRTVVYIRLSARGVCKWKCRFAAYLLPPTPALPHGGGGVFNKLSGYLFYSTINGLVGVEAAWFDST